MLVANKFLAKAGDDLSDKQPGDPIPEAAKWPNLRMYLAQKWIIDVPDSTPAAQPSTDAIPPAPVVSVAPPGPSIEEVTSTKEEAPKIEATTESSAPLPQVEQPRKRGRPRKFF